MQLTLPLAMMPVFLFLLAPLIAPVAPAQTVVDSAEVAEGRYLGRLLIPSIGLDVSLVEGISEESLRDAVGHYPGTPLPGQPGNVAIAGHRVTHQRPFHRLDEVRPGDLVVVQAESGRYTYVALREVDGHANPWVVKPADVDVVGPEGSVSVLTLTTCHPKGSARQRLVLRAELVATAHTRAAGW